MINFKFFKLEEADQLNDFLKDHYLSAENAVNVFSTGIVVKYETDRGFSKVDYINSLRKSLRAEDAASLIFEGQIEEATIAIAEMTADKERLESKLKEIENAPVYEKGKMAYDNKSAVKEEIRVVTGQINAENNKLLIAKNALATNAYKKKSILNLLDKYEAGN